MGRTPHGEQNVLQSDEDGGNQVDRSVIPHSILNF